jgi:hypothetical protein
MAVAVNEQNVVVGTRIQPDSFPRPLVWRNLDGPAEELPLPAGAHNAKPTDIDNDATIVGVLGMSALDPGRGYVWCVYQGIVDAIAGFEQKPGQLRLVPVFLDLRTDTFTVLADVASPVGNGWGPCRSVRRRRHPDRRGDARGTPAASCRTPVTRPPPTSPSRSSRYSATMLK